eukprot:gene10558-7330_t
MLEHGHTSGMHYFGFFYRTLLFALSVSFSLSLPPLDPANINFLIHSIIHSIVSTGFSHTKTHTIYIYIYIVCERSTRRPIFLSRQLTPFCFLCSVLSHSFNLLRMTSHPKDVPSTLFGGRFRIHDRDEKERKIGSIKRNLSLSDICRGCPHCFVLLLNYARKMKFEEEPAYEMICGLLMKELAERNEMCDNIFDWDVEPGQEPVLSPVRNTVLSGQENVPYAPNDAAALQSDADAKGILSGPHGKHKNESNYRYQSLACSIVQSPPLPPQYRYSRFLDVKEGDGMKWFLELGSPNSSSTFVASSSIFPPLRYCCTDSGFAFAFSPPLYLLLTYTLFMSFFFSVFVMLLFITITIIIIVITGHYYIFFSSSLPPLPKSRLFVGDYYYVFLFRLHSSYSSEQGRPPTRMGVRRDTFLYFLSDSHTQQRERDRETVCVWRPEKTTTKSSRNRDTAETSKIERSGCGSLSHRGRWFLLLSRMHWCWDVEHREFHRLDELEKNNNNKEAINSYRRVSFLYCSVPSSSFCFLFFSREFLPASYLLSFGCFWLFFRSILMCTAQQTPHHPPHAQLN